jgi:hypothetical protein
MTQTVVKLGPSHKFQTRKLVRWSATYQIEETGDTHGSPGKKEGSDTQLHYMAMGRKFEMIDSQKCVVTLP